MGIDTIFILLGGTLKKWNIGNGRQHLHIMQIAQGCQSCITQDLHMHHPGISELQKTLVVRQNKVITHTAGLLRELGHVLEFFFWKSGLRFWAYVAAVPRVQVTSYFTTRFSLWLTISSAGASGEGRGGLPPWGNFPPPFCEFIISKEELMFLNALLALYFISSHAWGCSLTY